MEKKRQQQQQQQKSVLIKTCLEGKIVRSGFFFFLRSSGVELLKPYCASNMLESNRTTLQATAGDKEEEEGKKTSQKSK